MENSATPAAAPSSARPFNELVAQSSITIDAMILRDRQSLTLLTDEAYDLFHTLGLCFGIDTGATPHPRLVHTASDAA